MRIFRIIGRSINSSFKSIFRNFSLSMASITCTIITLLLVSIGILLSYNINNITKDIENELTIVILMDKKITSEELDVAKTTLKSVDNVENVKFNSKEAIKKDLASQNDTYAKIVETWGEDENPLQDSFVITVVNVKDINETATTIKNIDKVDRVKYGESMVNELINIFDVVKNATIVLVVALVLVTTFLIGNTIKITIFSRRSEIDIMRLVGTSNTVIKLPFIIEGFLLGTIGSIIPILITIIGYTYAFNSLSSAEMTNILNVIKLTEPSSIVYLTSLILLIIGSVVGMLGSLRAVRRYLTI
ncbi:MAG: permease-like cell division protein FtsX [Bacilli bacterium]|nr:permease-like cell division protein FtsX [Bacilli bacterium]MDD4406851.1 permease-like cell division protein FtsX [Bacilli bacterium]